MQFNYFNLNRLWVILLKFLNKTLLVQKTSATPNASTEFHADEANQRVLFFNMNKDKNKKKKP